MMCPTTISYLLTPLCSTILLLIPEKTKRYAEYDYFSEDYGYLQDIEYDYQSEYEDINYGHQECGTIEDCFNEPCPRFGYAVKITFTRQGSPSSSKQSLPITGEGFRSRLPPNCNLIVK